jgi:hypothetical protein
MKQVFGCEFWDFHNSVTEDSSLLGCGAVSLGVSKHSEGMILRRVSVIVKGRVSA